MVLRWQADSIICDLQVQCFIEPEADVADVSLRVAYDVGKGFLGDAVYGHLDRCRQRRKCLLGCNRHLQSVRIGLSTVPGSLFADGTDQPQLVESRWTQFIDQAADVSDDRTQGGAPLRYERIRSSRILWDERPNCTCLQVEGSECRTQTIMQITAQAAAFLLPCRDQALTGMLQITGQPYRVCCQTCMTSQFIQQTFVSGGESFTRSPRREVQLTDSFILVNKR